MITLPERANDAVVRSARRTALTHHATQIGIDFVAVDLDRRLLTVQFLAAVGVTKATRLATITRRNIRVTAGSDTRPANLRVIQVDAQEERNCLLVSYELDGHPARGSDFTSYELALVDVPTVDPFFARAAFSLRPDEPAVFDPIPTPLPPAASTTDIEIDYLARDYASMRRLMLDRLSLRMPRWNERSPADLGVAVVEVLAYAADQLSYYQDAVATEAYLGTARRRTSVRRHARLLDYVVHEGCNARVWVQILFTGDAVALSQGTPLLTRSGTDARIAPGSSLLPQMLANGAHWFETLHGAVLFAAHRELRVYTWGARDYVLPAGSVSATLHDDWLDPGDPLRGRKLDQLQAGQVLIVEETKGPASGEPVDADSGRRHVVRLTRVTRGVDPLGESNTGSAGLAGVPTSHGVPVVEIEWTRADALPFALTVACVRDGQVVEDVSVFRGNLVLADHGRTIDLESLPAVPTLGRYRPQLQRGRLSYRAPYDSVLASTQPAIAATHQDARAAVPQVSLKERSNGATRPSARWTPVGDLLASDRFASEFVVETETNGRATLRFGDGVRGRQPSPGVVFEARYRIGNGVDGNVGSESIAHIVSNDVRLTAVRNPLPAVGGTEPEPLDQVRLQAPSAFKTQERCVTVADYRVVAQRHPEVRQAAATLRWTGSWYTAFVAVVRQDRNPVDEAFRKSVQSFLGVFQPAGLDLEISAPRYVALDVRIVVHVGDNHFRSTVRQMLHEAFSSADLPNGRQGFFHPDRFGFGQPVYLSQLVAAAMGIAGVVQADVDRFQRWGRAAQGEIEAGRVDIGPLEIARVDSDPNAPENGLVTFLVEGGQ